MSILVTGASGFIGFHVCNRLLQEGREVIGVDSMNDYYDVELKKARLAMLQDHDGFTFHQFDLADHQSVLGLYELGITSIVHLAAQAGVRYSIENPIAYHQANQVATLEMLELARAIQVDHMVFASSSSVYGSNQHVLCSTQDSVDTPISYYAASKRTGELLAHSYAHLYRTPVTAVRFFTVYGPWGRPDMALWKFAEAIESGNSIDLFNHGRHRRDFTYIDDIVEGVVKVLDHPAKPDLDFNPLSPLPDHSDAPFAIYNIGNDVSVELTRYVDLIEAELGKTAERNLLPLQPGDIEESLADVEPMRRDFGWTPKVSVEEGVPRFIEWFKTWTSRA